MQAFNVGKQWLMAPSTGVNNSHMKGVIIIFKQFYISVLYLTLWVDAKRWNDMPLDFQERNLNCKEEILMSFSF